MPREIGQRVGAISHGEGAKVYMFGYGVYEGDHVPPSNVGGFNSGQPNPRIKLDNGKTVFGCECWWGPEEVIKDRVEGKQIIEVDIDEARAKSAANTVS